MPAYDNGLTYYIQKFQKDLGISLRLGGDGIGGHCGLCSQVENVFDSLVRIKEEGKFLKFSCVFVSGPNTLQREFSYSSGCVQIAFKQRARQY